ncbi:MAG: hypothetical protein LBI61_00015 [Puniceicoccales bacterium]|nr:hypothetical protein [Puniceicoccales bacterium]
MDAATPLIQVVAICDGTILCARSCVGNAATAISPLVSELLAATGYAFGDFAAMAFCSGPGSALGLRAALISIKTWLIFGKNPCQLLEYCSLDMCLGLNQNADCACAHGVGDSLIAKPRGSGVEVLSAGEGALHGAAVFLETRRTAGKDSGYAVANYAIGGANFDPLSICRPSNGELGDYGSIAYRKWERPLE